MTIRRMRIACWIPKVTNLHSEYVVLIAFPLQQWLHERASMLGYTYEGEPHENLLLLLGLEPLTVYPAA